MTRVFIDTSAVLALVNPDDEQHTAARQAFQGLSASSSTLITTSYVLVELYALLGRRMGMEAVERFRQTLAPRVDVVWVDHELHEAALDLLIVRKERRLSLVDAVSFLAIRRLRLDGAFSCDRHFRDEGFVTVP